jgi:hypothetical protein
MTRRRLRPRVETDLIRFSVDACIKNKPDARHSFGPHTLLDEVVNGIYRLVVYTNGRRTQTSFPIVELPIKGTIKHPIPVDKRIRFYIAHAGKKYEHVYLNPKTQEFGTTDSLRAIWTCQSIGEKAKPSWRASKLARKGRSYRHSPKL